MATRPDEGGDSRYVDQFIEYYRTYEKEALGEWATGDETDFVINLSDLVVFDSGLYQDALHHPDDLRDHAETALKRVELPAPVDREDATVRFGDLANEARTFDVGEYRTDDLDEIINVRGQVNKVTEPRGRVEVAHFICQRCGTATRIKQSGDSGYDKPHECQGCERQGPFKIDLKQSDELDIQHARIQLPPEKAAGSSSRHFDVVLESDHVDVLRPGDRVELTTVLRGHVDPSDDSREFDLTGDVESARIRETDFEDLDPSEHADRIDEVVADGPFEAITGSIAPTLHGLENLKLAVGLQLFGGVKKELPDDRIERGVSHVLFVGDPGTAKSELLEYAARVAPRSVSTDGKGSSSAGLTAAAVRDDFGPGGEWTIEGGALVEAHRGLCCIDELDKMDSNERDALHTALAHQKVPISKAGITTTLPARTTVLAAANPTHSRFDPYESTAEQIDLAPTLISRFDLIFTVTDHNDPDEDRAIIEHKADAQELGQRISAGVEVPDRLGRQMKPTVDTEVFRCWVARARQLAPVLTPDAKAMLIEEFATLRQAGEDAAGPVPVTMRKQDAIARLAEASARARLSEWVETDDVTRALSLVRQSLEDVGIDPETGEFDADVIETGTSTTQRNRVQQVAAIVADLESETEYGAPHDEVVSVLTQDDDVGQGKAEHTIEKALNHGNIYQPSNGYYRTA